MTSLSSCLYDLSGQNCFDADWITSKYETWVQEDRYMILSHEREPWIANPYKAEYVGVKCSKRGNDVYSKRVADRMKGISHYIPQETIDYEKNNFAQILLVTLTYDTKLCSFSEAWKSIGIDYNRFRANLEQKYGRISTFRAFESYDNGHPHIHMIVVFNEYKFRVFKSYEESKIHPGKLKTVWRIHEKSDLEPYWHSYIDVRAVDNLCYSINYIKKYVTKASHFEGHGKKSVKTLAMCWIFRKKAFYVSGQFKKALSDLIKSLCISKRTLTQVDLFGTVPKSNSWCVLGFVGRKTLGEIGNEWTIPLTKEQINDCFSEWSNYKKYD